MSSERTTSLPGRFVSRLSRSLSAPIIHWLTSVRAPRGYPLSDFNRIRDELRVCDVVLVEGRSRASNVIKLITQSHWSHAALYIGRLKDIKHPELRRLIQMHIVADPNEPLIVESELGIGTAIRPISVYRDEHLRICRPRGLDPRDANAVLAHAVGRVGNSYNIRQILDLARFLFPWAIMPRRWRSTLFNHNVGQQTRSVCSTMIADAFDTIKFPILPLVKRIDGVTVQLFRRNPQLCTPSDFDYSPYFEIIKYPFLDLTTHSSFCLVPWENEPVAPADSLQFSQSQIGVYLPDPDARPDGRVVPFYGRSVESEPN